MARAAGRRWARRMWRQVVVGGLFLWCLCGLDAGVCGFASIRIERDVAMPGKRIKFHPTEGLWRPEGPAPPLPKRRTKMMTQEEMEQAELFKDLRKYADAGDWERALNHLSLMREDGRVPSQDAYLAGIEACTKDERWAEALEVLDAARAELRWPESHLFAAALDVLPPGHDNLIEEVMGHAELAPPSWVLYESAIAAYARGGHLEEAKSLFRKALAEGLVQVWAQAGDLDLSQMRQEAAVVAACATVEDHSKMQQTRGAGGGFTIFTGPAKRYNNERQLEILQALRQEFGIKIRVSPIAMGQMQITHEALRGLLAPGEAAPREDGYHPKPFRPKKSFAQRKKRKTGHRV